MSLKQRNGTCSPEAKSFIIEAGYEFVTHASYGTRAAHRGSKMHKIPSRTFVDKKTSQATQCYLSRGSLALTFMLLSGCGAINKLYPERKAKCKVNCENQSGGRGADNGQVRESLNLPLDYQFWLDATPRTQLSDAEVAQLLISNPLVPTGSDDPSHSQLGKSIGAALSEIDKRIATGFGIDNDTRNKKPAADCYRKLLEKDPTKTGDNLIYEINLGLCFSLGQIQQSLAPSVESGGGNGAGQASVTALAYEDAIRIALPQNQIKFSLGDANEPFHLVDFGQAPSRLFLPFLKPAMRPLRVIDLSHAQINGVQVKQQNMQPYYELAWDYVALTSSKGNSGFTITDSSDTAAKTLAWSIQGRFIHASGNTRDPNGLRLKQAADAAGYIRVVEFDSFSVRFAKPEGGADTDSLHAPADGFGAGTTASLSGSYTVSIAQGQGALKFKVLGLDKPCEVEIFAGTETTESNSLGITNLCKTADTPLAVNLVGFQALSKTQP